MKRFIHITTLLVATAALSASALAQNGATPNGATGGSAGSPGDASMSSGTSGTSVTTSTSSEQVQSSTDTLSGDPGLGGDESLPKTGGEPMVFVLGGIALMGTALVMRRKSANFG